MSVCKKSRREITQANAGTGNGIDLFPREGNNLDRWVHKLFDEAIREYNSLSQLEEQQIKEERQRLKKQALRAQKKRAQRTNAVVNSSSAPDQKTLIVLPTLR